MFLAWSSKWVLVCLLKLRLELRAEIYKNTQRSLCAWVGIRWETQRAFGLFEKGLLEQTSCYLIEIQASSNLLYSNSQAIPLSGDCEIVIDWIGWDTDGPIKHVYSFGLFGEWYCCWLAIRPLGLLIQGFSQFRVDQSHSEGLKHRLLGPAPQSYWFNRLMVGP